MMITMLPGYVAPRLSQAKRIAWGLLRERAMRIPAGLHAATFRPMKSFSVIPLLVLLTAPSQPGPETPVQLLSCRAFLDLPEPNQSFLLTAMRDGYVAAIAALKAVQRDYADDSPSRGAMMPSLQLATQLLESAVPVSVPEMLQPFREHVVSC